MGAVIAETEIYDIVSGVGDLRCTVEFRNGYTSSAHPLACVAGVAALDVLISEDMPDRVQALAPHFENHIRPADRLAWSAVTSPCRSQQAHSDRRLKI